MIFSGLSSFLSAYRGKELCPKGSVGVRFEREMFPRRFRELITFYRDGKILFERYCFGEAAGLVLQLWADSMDETGQITFGIKSEHDLASGSVPAVLQDAGEKGLLFDNSKDIWHFESVLKSDKAHGYRKFFFFGK